MKNFARHFFISGLFAITSTTAYAQPSSPTAPTPPPAPQVIIPDQLYQNFLNQNSSAQRVSCDNLHRFKTADYNILQHLNHAFSCVREIERSISRDIVGPAKKADGIKLQSLQGYMKVETSLSDNLGFKPKKNQEAIQESKDKLDTAVSEYQQCQAASEEAMDKLSQLERYVTRFYELDYQNTKDYEDLTKNPAQSQHAISEHNKLKVFYNRHAKSTKQFQQYKEQAIATYNKGDIDSKTKPSSLAQADLRNWSVRSLQEYCEQGSVNTNLIQKNFDSFGYKLNKIVLWGGAIGLAGWGAYEIYDHDRDRDKKKKREREQKKVSECLKNINAHDNCEELIKKYVEKCKKNDDAHPECAAILRFNTCELSQSCDDSGAHANAGPHPEDTAGEIPPEIRGADISVGPESDRVCVTNGDAPIDPDAPLEFTECSPGENNSGGESSSSSSSGGDSSSSSDDGGFDFGGDDAGGTVDVVPLNTSSAESDQSSQSTQPAPSTTGDTPDVIITEPGCLAEFNDGIGGTVDCDAPVLNDSCTLLETQSNGVRVFDCNVASSSFLNSNDGTQSSNDSNSPEHNPEDFGSAGVPVENVVVGEGSNDSTSVETVVDILDNNSRGSERNLSSPSEKSQQLKKKISNLLK